MLARLLRSLVRRHIDMRRNQFDVLPLPEQRVLFLGDSITEAGNWNEWFPRYPTLNRGIGGDTVEGLRSRLGAALNRPAAISLLIGTNDLHGRRRTAKVADIAARFEELVHQIRTLTPDSPLIVNSVMPRDRRWASRIHELNARYAATVRDVDATYIDLWPALADGDALRAAYTRDGIHLNGHGYQAWVDVLRPRLEAVLGNAYAPHA
jgi:lysophospholipase L1-like esterase